MLIDHPTFEGMRFPPLCSRHPLHSQPCPLCQDEQTELMDLLHNPAHHMPFTYQAPDFRLVFHPEDGSVVTFFSEDDTCCPVQTNDDHWWHAAQLGQPFTGPLYNLAHELAHHLVGMTVLGQPYSPIIWRTAHQLPMVDPAREQEEWMTTALTYFALSKKADYGALLDIARQTNPREVADFFNWLLLPVLQGLPVSDIVLTPSLVRG